MLSITGAPNPLSGLNSGLTDDFVRHGITGYEDTAGRETYKRWAEEFLTAYPDFHNETLDMISEGDRVVQRYRLTGTNSGDFRGRPATGKKVSVEGIEIARMVDGKVAEVWAFPNTLGYLQQLGLI